ncbi:thermonuclease family protein [Methylocystis sp. H4A]|uniref:thermonuclease family protein n=1 Tax=Methylocystis sp. H4A TaxID=2785788 RepID=UPI0032B2473F
MIASMKRIIITIVAATLSSAALADVVGRASVIDGDTIEIHGQRIRLHGIDAPEKGQPCFDASGKSYRCGQIAAMALDEFIGASPVACRERDTDRYGRTVATCAVRGVDIEAWLVRNGHAFAYRRYSSDHIGAEQEAKNAKRGLWAGSAQPPWEWRKDRRGGL